MEKGDSLASVAKRFGTTAGALRQRNRHSRVGGIPEDARLIVPVLNGVSNGLGMAHWTAHRSLWPPRW